MKKGPYFLGVMLLSCLSFSLWAKAHIHVTNQFQTIVDFVEKDPHKTTLLVLDDDDTLTTTLPQQPLGSPAWFAWQASFCDTKKRCHGQYAVASTFDGLVKVQRVLFVLNKVQLTEPHLTDLLKRLIKRDHTQIILETARPPDWQNITEIQLQELQMTDDKHQNLFKSSGLIASDGTSDYPALHCADPFLNGQPIAYAHGAFYVTGQHKGHALACLLQTLDPHQRIERIIFVDDQLSNIRDMVNYFNAHPAFHVAVHAFHYTRETAKQKAFSKDEDNQQEKVDVIWKNLSRDIKKVLPDADLP